jgi:hypothetical protein
VSLANQPASIRPGALLLIILVAGLAAGLLAATFHAAATEPIIDQAIMIEEMRHAGEEAEPAVSRDVQKVGLFVGWGVLGLVYAALLAVSYAVARARGWVGSGWVAPVLLAAVGYWAVALLPALKYPANPPGVGDPETIGFRQATYVACWTLAIVGAILSAVIAGRLPLARDRKAAAGVLIYVVWSLALWLFLPANPDPVTMPSGIVDGFRIRSVEGLTLFWVVLGLIFAAFSARLTARGSA